MTVETTVKKKVAVKEKTKKADGPRRINNTNLNYAAHHYHQALLSLGRANTMMNDLAANSGRAGEMAREVTELGNHANSTIIELESRIESLSAEMRAFFGQ